MFKGLSNIRLFAQGNNTFDFMVFWQFYDLDNDDGQTWTCKNSCRIVLNAISDKNTERVAQIP